MAKSNTKYRREYNPQDELDLDNKAVRHELDPIAEPNKPEPIVEQLVTGEQVPVIPDAELAPEEKTYKQRYADLRTYQQKQQKELMDRIDDLQRQITDSTKKEFTLPKTDAEYAEWVAKFPDVAAMVETAAGKKAKEILESANERLAYVEKRSVEVEQEKALNKIKTKHPDFDELRNDSKFHAWAETQPKWVRDALYVDNDPDGAIRAIDLYKYDTKPTAPKVTPAAEARAAAQAVRTNSSKADLSNTPGGNTEKILESWIKSLTPRQFEKFEDMIDEARAKGNIVYDISGGAR